MPTPIKKHRTYCKACENFTLHSWKSKEELCCDTCGKQEDGYNIDEVNPELIKEQRLRYQKQRQNYFGSIYSKYVLTGGIDTLLGLDEIKQNIIECDAGQRQIDEERKAKREAARLKRLEEIDYFNQNFKHLGRNDKCSCGSGKKYKQCHLIIYRDKGIG